MDFGDEDKCNGCSDNGLADECNIYVAAASNTHHAFQLGFSSSRPGNFDKYGNPIITIINRSEIHEISVRWCCCPDAAGHDMQMIKAGLFPATFQNPKMAFTFKVLEEFHLDNLECKTTPSQFISQPRRLTSDEFPNTVPVGHASIPADGRLIGRYRVNNESC